jgi:hypothetical protein
MSRAVVSRFVHIACAIAAGLFVTVNRARASEEFSESVYVPPTTALDPVTYAQADLSQVWRHFHILLGGDPVLPTQDPTDKNTDPFAVNGTSTITTANPYIFPAAANGLWVGPGPIKTPGLTSVTFNGSVPINQANIPNQGLDNPTDRVQFGLVGPVNNTPLNIIGQHWGYEATLAPFLRGVPVVSVRPSIVAPATPPPGEQFQYIVNFIQFTQNGISGTEWAEFPYLPGEQPTFTYGGWADFVDRIHFTANEIQLSPTEIPLDDLNFADDPLGGTSASPAFTIEALPEDIVPEPDAAGLLISGAILILGWRLRPNLIRGWVSFQ